MELGFSKILETFKTGILTNTLDFQVYPWTHDFIPTVDAPYEPSRAIEAACPAEWMREGSCRGEIMLDRGALLLRWTLTKLMYDLRDLGDCRVCQFLRSRAFGEALCSWDTWIFHSCDSSERRAAKEWCCSRAG